MLVCMRSYGGARKSQQTRSRLPGLLTLKSAGESCLPPEHPRLEGRNLDKKEYSICVEMHSKIRVPELMHGDVLSSMFKAGMAVPSHRDTWQRFRSDFGNAVGQLFSPALDIAYSNNRSRGQYPCLSRTSPPESLTSITPEGVPQMCCC